MRMRGEGIVERWVRQEKNTNRRGSGELNDNGRGA
jgi:hypothetical protein